MPLKLTDAHGHTKASKHGKAAVYGIVFQLLIEVKLSEEKNNKRCDTVE
jgi:hypothetical protein